jgi:hypothetical protein
VAWAVPSARVVCDSSDLSVPAPAVAGCLLMSAGQVAMHWPVQLLVPFLSLVKA